MLPARIWRNTPARTALLFTALFLGVLLIAGFVTFNSIQDELSDRLNTRVMERFHELENEFGEEGLPGLIERINNLDAAAATSGSNGLVSLTDDQGTVLAGRDDIISPQTGLHKVRVARPIDAEHDSYTAMHGPVGEMKLTVGINSHDIDEVEEVMLENMAWAALAIVLLAVAGGLLLSLRLKTRFDGLRNALEKVATGQWDTRLPITAQKDDIDDFSGTINTTLDRLQGLMEAMRQVSADIAHDLKTPLARLYISIEQALDLLEKGKDAKPDLQSVKEEAETINATFEALLSIAQLEGGARKDRFRNVDLHDLVSGFVDIYQPVAEETGCNLRLRTQPDFSPTIWGDKDLLNQLLANLVENALRHCPIGTDVLVELERAGHSSVLLSVSDNGPGVPQADREKVLRRLYRLERSRTTPGSGLGLSLVKAIADIHNVDLTLTDNQPGLRVSLTFNSIMQSPNK
ncbi:MAG: ATP-binding protein [Rhizobiaceae bacterium]|nr:ATP-binding protein [Rhizobiaceae bacterium]